MHFALTTLFSRHAVASFDKQRHLTDLVAELDWSFDLALGRLCFGDCISWPAQILGTESEESETWLWAWANKSCEIPPFLLQSSETMRELGETRLIDELRDPQLQLQGFDGHILAMIASGVCNANAYFRAPYEGGAAFLLIKDEAFPRTTQPPLARIAVVFPEALSNLEIQNHRVALFGVLEYYGFKCEQSENQIIVRTNGEVVLVATFDESDRLTEMEVTFEGEE